MSGDASRIAGQMRALQRTVAALDPRIKGVLTLAQTKAVVGTIVDKVPAALGGHLVRIELRLRALEAAR